LRGDTQNVGKEIGKNVKKTRTKESAGGEGYGRYEYWGLRIGNEEATDQELGNLGVMGNLELKILRDLVGGKGGTTKLGE